MSLKLPLINSMNSMKSFFCYSVMNTMKKLLSANVKYKQNKNNSKSRFLLYYFFKGLLEW